MIVVDGRTDREKLVELLQLPEQTHLEFKAQLDLNSKHDELNFVKDAVSMSNRPPGGYILVGVNDDGTLALRTGTVADRALFDGARLGDLIRKYIEGEVHVISQVHEVNGHEVVLIYLPHHRDRASTHRNCSQRAQARSSLLRELTRCSVNCLPLWRRWTVSPSHRSRPRWRWRA